MRYVRSVSIPRSGHHLLVRLLENYCDPVEFKYLPRFERPEVPKVQVRSFKQEVLFRFRRRLAGKRRLRASWTGAKWNVDERISEIVFSKNHDFDLSLTNDYSIQHVVLCRHPLVSGVSNYYVYIERLGLPDTKEAWEDYNVEGFVEYWKRFVYKWILTNTNPNVCVVTYERLTTFPQETLQTVLEFIFPNRPIQYERLVSVCSEEKIRPVRDVSRFEWFDQELFQRIEMRVEPELERLGIRPMFRLAVASD